MASIDQRLGQSEAAAASAPAAAVAGWGNSAPLALAAFALTTFMPSRASTGLVHAGGYLGLIVAALAGYLWAAEVCEATYKRAVLPVWPLAKH